MRLLILGGTIFLGRHVAAEALARGHAVTIFHRGRHGTGILPEAEHLFGDRTVDLSALDGRRWDAVIDTSGYQPGDVRASTERIAGAADHLGFVSTCSVYRAWPAEPVSESSAVWDEGDDYGQAKAASERAAEAAMPGRVAHYRAGLLCGPDDNVFRLPWWVRRIARGGDVVAPGDPRRTVQLIDARDLASWFVDLAEQHRAGVFNATAPAGVTTMGDVLEAILAATGSGARLRWIPDESLVAAGVEPWTELPLWAPERDMPGTWRVATARAHAAGLRCRPVADTVADVWAWLQAGGEHRMPAWGSDNRPAEMPPARERELLQLAD
jgi:nucleoside-diphosphate-sugar epimerase